jgi:hypothetical protein
MSGEGYSRSIRVSRSHFLRKSSGRKLLAAGLGAVGLGGLAYGASHMVDPSFYNIAPDIYSEGVLPAKHWTQDRYADVAYSEPEKRDLAGRQFEDRHHVNTREWLENIQDAANSHPGTSTPATPAAVDHGQKSLARFQHSMMGWTPYASSGLPWDKWDPEDRDMAVRDGSDFGWTPEQVEKYGPKGPLYFGWPAGPLSTEGKRPLTAQDPTRQS